MCQTPGRANPQNKLVSVKSLRLCMPMMNERKKDVSIFTSNQLPQACWSASSISILRQGYLYLLHHYQTLQHLYSWRTFLQPIHNKHVLVFMNAKKKAKHIKLIQNNIMHLKKVYGSHGKTLTDRFRNLNTQSH